MWASAHKQIEGNEKSDKLARKNSANKFLGSEPGLRTPNYVVRGAIRDRVRKDHITCCGSAPGNTHGKLVINASFAKKTELLKLSRSQAKTVSRFLTGHWENVSLLRKNLHAM